MIVRMSFLGGVGRAFRAGVWVLIAAGVVIFGWIWLIADRSGQEKMMMTVPLLAVMGVLAIGALVAVQGPWRRVARGVAAVLVAIGLAMPALFRLKGLTGDFFPVLEYRFAPKHDTTLPGLPGEAAVAAPAPLPVDPVTTTTTRRHDDTMDGSGTATPGKSAPASAEATAGEPQHHTRVLRHPPPPRLRRASQARRHF